MNASFFSETYSEARERFCRLAREIGATIHSYPIAGRDQLKIDVALLGRSSSERAIVVSSGLHGVEGFLGSAIQAAWLESVVDRGIGGGIGGDLRFVLIHGINPHGFESVRRCNEDNVDLNRNFHDCDSQYAGSPELYGRFDPLLNPKHATRPIDTFRLSALGHVLRHGLPSLKETIAGGQYEYSEGLFFGGHGPCESTRVIQGNFASWLAGAGEVVHLDIHSGLGKFGQCQLLLVQREGDPGIQWYQQVFGTDCVSALAGGEGFAYVAAGAMGAWLRRNFVGGNYRFVTAEFGTFGPLRVLNALRRENQAHFYNRPTDRMYRSAKKELLECFCPSSDCWRNEVVATGLNLISKTASALCRQDRTGD